MYKKKKKKESMRIKTTKIMTRILTNDPRYIHYYSLPDKRQYTIRKHLIPVETAVSLLCRR